MDLGGVETKSAKLICATNFSRSSFFQSVITMFTEQEQVKSKDFRLSCLEGTWDSF